jgi:hypothetical protein
MGGRRANARPAPILGTHLGAQFWGRGCNWAPILGGRAQVGAPTAGGVLFTQPEGAPESVALDERRRRRREFSVAPVLLQPPVDCGELRLDPLRRRPPVGPESVHRTACVSDLRQVALRLVLSLRAGLSFLWRIGGRFFG